MEFKDFKTNEQGLIPVIAQDCQTNEVLMLAYMNEEAFNKTMETKRAYYYSRSRQKLWMKGETSGHVQDVKKVLVDCDEDTLILQVVQTGPACHTGNDTCFYRELLSSSNEEIRAKASSKIMEEVYQTVVHRRDNPKEGSYTNYLFNEGIDKILKKVGEETAEVIIGAKNEGCDEIIYEISDLIYHLTVLIVNKGTTWQAIFDELASRH